MLSFTGNASMPKNYLSKQHLGCEAEAPAINKVGINLLGDLTNNVSHLSCTGADHDCLACLENI